MNEGTETGKVQKSFTGVKRAMPKNASEAGPAVIGGFPGISCPECTKRY